MVIVGLFFLSIFAFFVWAMMSFVICPHYVDNNSLKNKIEFDSVKKFYPINPNKWRLGEGYVVYNGMQKFRFNFIDYWRYRSWLKKQRKFQAMEAQNDALAAVIKDVKKDIAKFEAKNDAYVEQQLNSIWVR